MYMTNLSFIKPIKSFRYSINIKFDHGDIEKVNSFIPTARSIELFSSLYQSFNGESATRAHILVGAYGTGKSLFGNILGTILSEKSSGEKYELFIEKVKRFNLNLAQKMKYEIEKKAPYLLVLPDTDSSTFKQAMLSGLLQALKRDRLDNIFPETYYQSVYKKIEQWAEKYPDTFNTFVHILEKEYGESIEDFKKDLLNFNQESYNFFLKIYPELTSGGEFNPFYSCSLIDIYTKVCREIRKKGYQGIYIIFDEFNKLLENNITIFNGKELQDFAEMATRSAENEIHLLLISHKSLLQYTADLPKQQIDEWKKVEGRFKILDASQYSSQVYELMSNVILKEGKEWLEFQQKNQDKFYSFKKTIKELGLCPDYSEEEIERFLVKGCYPLHPLTAILLPKLSQRIAQNERTIFTYLSTDDENTLIDFINKNQEEAFPLIRPSGIYNYFEGLMRQELDFTQVHRAWSDTQRALQKLNRNDINEREFLKTLGIINAVNSFSEIPPSRQILRFALDYLTDDEFNLLVENLIKNKIIMFRKSINQFVFFEGSETDFAKLIEEKKSEFKNNFSGKYLLNDYFKPLPIIPKQYNDNYKIIRYFIYEFLYFEEFRNITDWEEYLVKYNKKSYLDGMVIFLILKNEMEIKLAKEVLRNIDNKRIIFVLPKKPVLIDELLLELDALRELLKDKKFLARDPFAEQELKFYLEESIDLISNRLNKFINPSFQNSLYFNKGEICKHIKTQRNLTEYVSVICSNVFCKTPHLNNELIVKDNITAPQKSARKKIVNKILFSNLPKRLGITGYGPDFLMFRTLFIKTNLLIKRNDKLEFNPALINEALINEYPTIEPNLKEVLAEIVTLFKKDRINKIGEIYDILRRPPYGIRLGIMPILLSVASRLSQQLYRIVIRHNGEEVDINEELFEKINEYPDRYTVEVNQLNKYKEEYLVFLKNEFKDYIPNDEFSEVNKVKYIYKAIIRWYQSLPKYAKETSNLSDTSMLIRNIITKRTSEINKLLLEIIPMKTINKDLQTKEDLDSLKELIKKFKIEEEEVYKKLTNKLLLELRFIFYDNMNPDSLAENLKRWYQSLPDNLRNNTYNNETNTFLNILRKNAEKLMDDDQILKKLSINLTGFVMEDWNDSTFKSFVERIRNIKKEIEEGSKNTTKGNYEFIIKDKTGHKYRRIFEETDLSELGKLLDSKIRSSFYDMGRSVSDREKQQILINILKEMFEKTAG